jgi:hypothetical protein
MHYMFYRAFAFDQDITGWSTPALTTNKNMFYIATAWLAKFVRVDGSGSVDGPPSAWQFPPLRLTQSSFKAAIDACLATHPVDGLCVDSEYGPMPRWDTSAVTSMYGAFSGRSEFNGDISGRGLHSSTLQLNLSHF